MSTAIFRDSQKVIQGPIQSYYNYNYNSIYYKYTPQKRFAPLSLISLYFKLPIPGKSGKMISLIKLIF